MHGVLVFVLVLGIAAMVVPLVYVMGLRILWPPVEPGADRQLMRRLGVCGGVGLVVALVALVVDGSLTAR